MVVAQRFSDPALRTIQYLDETMRASFYAVELVRFVASGAAALEARTVYRPEAGARRAGPSLDEQAFLAGIDDVAFREALRAVLEACRDLGYRIVWGVRGASIKIPTMDRSDPLSVAWVFPDDQHNWSGLRNLTLGYQPASLRIRPSVAQIITRYGDALAAIPGGKRIVTANEDLLGYEFNRKTLPGNESAVIACLAQLAHDVQQAG